MSANTKYNTRDSFMTRGVARRTIGFLMVVASSALVTWFSPTILPIIAQAGGIVPFLLGLLFVVLGLTAVLGFMLKWLREHPKTHMFIVLVAIVAALFGGWTALAAIVDNLGNAMYFLLAVLAVVVLWLLDPADIIGWIGKRRDR